MHNKRKQQKIRRINNIGNNISCGVSFPIHLLSKNTINITKETLYKTEFMFFQKKKKREFMYFFKRKRNFFKNAGNSISKQKQK